jgi:flagellar hook-associated protein 1 FlgK
MQDKDSTPDPIALPPLCRAAMSAFALWEASRREDTKWSRTIAALRGGEVESLYGAFVARVGHEVKSAQTTLANAEAMQGAIKAQRESVSGVSIDEEMTNMMTFQRGYEASARVLTAMDQALETLIEHTGLVGL